MKSENCKIFLRFILIKTNYIVLITIFFVVFQKDITNRYERSKLQQQLSYLKQKNFKEISILNTNLNAVSVTLIEQISYFLKNGDWSIPTPLSPRDFKELGILVYLIFYH
jgi:hypothetical protein